MLNAETPPCIVYLVPLRDTAYYEPYTAYYSLSVAAGVFDGGELIANPSYASQLGEPPPPFDSP